MGLPCCTRDLGVATPVWEPLLLLGSDPWRICAQARMHWQQHGSTLLKKISHSGCRLSFFISCSFPMAALLPGACMFANMPACAAPVPFAGDVTAQAPWLLHYFFS